MSQVDTQYRSDSIAAAIELADIIGGFDGPVWPRMSLDLLASGVPRCEGEGDGGGDGAGEGEGAGDGEGEGGGEGGEDERVTKANKEAQRYRRELRETQNKLKKLEEQGLTEAEKLKKDAEDGVKRGETGTQKLRTANVILALSEEHGLSGGRAKAAAKLLDNVEFNDDDEPTNLKTALEAAEKVYGADVFAPADAKPPTPRVPRGPQPGGGGSRASDMDVAIRRAAGRR